MNIYLGNLSIEEIEARVDVKFPEELKTYMADKHSQSATVPEGKWHCFDMPFMLMCGGRRQQKTFLRTFIRWLGLLKNHCKLE